MKPITVNARSIADAWTSAVDLKPVVGAYEFVFVVHVSVHAGEEGWPHVSIIGARVNVESDDGAQQLLGFARPQQPFDIVPLPHPRHGSYVLHLPVQPGQVAALEKLREARDLTFRLMLVGTGKDDEGSHIVRAILNGFPVARSDWLRRLGAAGVRNVILLEVPLPIHESLPGSSAEITSSLQRAETQYRGGDYTACVGSCRLVIEALGKNLGIDWNAALSYFSKGRKSMTKQQREEALYAALRHYTHPPHHVSDGGDPKVYTRQEAQLALTLTCTAVSNNESA